MRGEQIFPLDWITNIKKLSASGGFVCLTYLTRGSAPGPRWGSTPDPVIG